MKGNVKSRKIQHDTHTPRPVEVNSESTVKLGAASKMDTELEYWVRGLNSKWQNGARFRDRIGNWEQY